MDMILFWEGDRLIFTQVFEKNFRDLNYYLLKRWRWVPTAVREEIAADSFYKLFKNSRKMKSESHIRATLFVIANREMISWVRRNKYSPEVPLFEEACEVSDELSDGWIDYNEILQRGIESLPTRMRETIMLYFYEKKQVHEIANIMGATRQTILNLRNKAIDKLLRLENATKHPKKYFYI
jgi:RNA polymerase sigma factor (sigma-70 family)